jgi:hypothetical protein
MPLLATGLELLITANQAVVYGRDLVIHYNETLVLKLYDGG